MTQQRIAQSAGYSSIAVAVALLFFLGFLVVSAEEGDVLNTVPVACTAEAKMCPDGSFVGRIAPDCTFAPCSNEQATEGERNMTGEEAVRAMQQSQEEARLVAERKQKELNEENRQEMSDLREQNRLETREMLGEQKGERVEMRTQRREEIQLALDERRATLVTKMEERKATMEENMLERKAKLELQTQARLGAYVDRVRDGMLNVVSKLRDIADRIKSRIEKMEDEHDIVLANAMDALDDAYRLIDMMEDSEGDVHAIKNIATDVLSSDDPQAYKEDIREAADLAKQGIKAIHSALQEAVEAIRANSPKEVSQCGDYTYSTCPVDCLRECVPNDCEGDVCTDDCDGENSCFKIAEENSTEVEEGDENIVE